jgi:hypothetical protein
MAGEAVPNVEAVESQTSPKEENLSIEKQIDTTKNKLVDLNVNTYSRLDTLQAEVGDAEAAEITAELVSKNIKFMDAAALSVYLDKEGNNWVDLSIRKNIGDLDVGLTHAGTIATDEQSTRASLAFGEHEILQGMDYGTEGKYVALGYTYTGNKLELGVEGLVNPTDVSDGQIKTNIKAGPVYARLAIPLTGQNDLKSYEVALGVELKPGVTITIKKPLDELGGSIGLTVGI